MIPKRIASIIKTGLFAGGLTVAAGSIFIDNMLSKKGIRKMIEKGDFHEGAPDEERRLESVTEILCSFSVPLSFRGLEGGAER